MQSVPSVAPVVVVSPDATAGDALAAALCRRSLDARVYAPSTDVESVVGTLLLNLGSATTMTDTQVRALVGRSTTRVVVVDGGYQSLPADVSVDVWLDNAATLDDLVRGVTAPVSGTNGHARTAHHRASDIDLLTAREREILAVLLTVSGTAEMARHLAISEHTVRTHLQNVLAKLGVHSRAEAASWALRNGLAPRGAGQENSP